MAPQGPVESEKRSNPHADPRKVPARETSLVQHVHLIEELRCRRMAGKRQMACQKRLRLKQVAVLVVIGGRQVAKPFATGTINPVRSDSHTDGQRCQADKRRSRPSDPQRRPATGSFRTRTFRQPFSGDGQPTRPPLQNRMTKAPEDGQNKQ